MVVLVLVVYRKNGQRYCLPVRFVFFSSINNNIIIFLELVTGHALAENILPSDPPTETTTDTLQPPVQHEDAPNEHGHSRNSSNTSQLSKASGYSSIHSHSHSRQSSSGDSGHIR